MIRLPLPYVRPFYYNFANPWLTTAGLERATVYCRDTGLATAFTKFRHFKLSHQQDLLVPSSTDSCKHRTRRCGPESSRSGLLIDHIFALYEQFSSTYRDCPLPSYPLAVEFWYPRSLGRRRMTLQQKSVRAKLEGSRLSNLVIGHHGSNALRACRRKGADKQAQPQAGCSRHTDRRGQASKQSDAQSHDDPLPALLSLFFGVCVWNI